MKSLIGKLQFTTSVVTSGRCFLRRLHDSTIGIRKPQYQVSIIKSMKADLKVW